MADWPSLISDGQIFETGGAITASTKATTITPNAVANTKGTFIPIGTTTINANSIMINQSNALATAREFLVDWSVGPTGSETIIINNLNFSMGGINNSAIYYFPITIPASTVISARCQSEAPSGNSMEVSYVVMGQGFLASSGYGGTIETYGARSSGATGGAQIEPGAATHTKGVWTAVGTTNSTIRQLTIALSNRDNSIRTTANWLMDIAIGAAAAETIIIPDLLITAHSTDDNMHPPVFPPFLVNIPPSTRIAVRAQSNIVDATDRLFDVILYGVG